MNDTVRRATLGKLLAASTLGFTGIGGMIGRSLAAGSAPLRPGIQQIIGRVTVNGKVAESGMLVGPGDTIVSEANSQAIYVIGQDAFLQRAGSTVTFSGGNGVEGLRILSGKLLSVFGRGNKRIETTTAVIGIRGTGCYIESEPRRVYFCLCYGVAELQPNADPNHVERIETRHHDHPVYIHHDATMPMMADASVINHADAELELLERLVGRQPPFGTTSDRSY